MNQEVSESNDYNAGQEGEEDELYDEFGNYIGPDLDSSDDDDDDSSDESDDESEDNESQIDDEMHENNNNNNMIIEHTNDINNSESITAAPQNQIVLHEDKIHYPSAESIYGPNVTTAVIDEDAMDIETPIIPPTAPSMTATSNSSSSSDVGMTKDESKRQIVKDDYLVHLLDGNSSSSRSRGIALCGKLQCGKSTLLNLLRSYTFTSDADTIARDVTHDKSKYTHTLLTEQKHNISLSSTPITLPLSNSNGQTYAITIMDTPGHVQFHDEVIASLKIMDGCVLCIDVIEGMTYMDEILLSSMIHNGLPIVLVLNKVDALILDLKLPLNDCYVKLKHVLDSVNVFIRGKGNGRYPLLSPLNGNVLFASSKHGFMFSLDSMVDLYMDHNLMDDEEEDEDEDDSDDEMNNNNNHHQQTAKKQIQNAMFGTPIFGIQKLSKTEFTKRLWGNVYYNPNTKKFTKKPSSTQYNKRTFCTFILEPLYKLYGLCIGEKEKDMNKVLREFGIYLSKDQLRSDVHVLLNIVMRKFFGDGRSFVDAVVKNV